jgi:hypothetical protein
MGVSVPLAMILSLGTEWKEALRQFPAGERYLSVTVRPFSRGIGGNRAGEYWTWFVDVHRFLPKVFQRSWVPLIVDSANVEPALFC